ncbi:hypothetical protein TNCV_3046101 [Trichonephila clavipes]|uniref:Uncharacterized protein n=1 Tax=Trichonephila clavipes TaxID=2585209 RepID=A0A8X6V0T4_TRICX|nr:hypothetical protein TNCV_3046101 [Trichonephila clavipes]
MLNHLRFDIFVLQETKLPVRLINTSNGCRPVKEHETTPLRIKGDREEVSNQLDNACSYWMKCPEFYCSRRVRPIIKQVQD